MLVLPFVPNEQAGMLVLPKNEQAGMLVPILSPKGFVCLASGFPPRGHEAK
ncbi:MAG: hypothetical protein ACPGWR_18905 [Ardenticatenaceae bacterium]